MKAWEVVGIRIINPDETQEVVCEDCAKEDELVHFYADTEHENIKPIFVSEEEAVNERCDRCGEHLVG